jgi:hypothetical protein
MEKAGIRPIREPTRLAWSSEGRTFVAVYSPRVVARRYPEHGVQLERDVVDKSARTKLYGPADAVAGELVKQTTQL